MKAREESPLIKGLGQVTVQTTDLDRWRTLAIDILGMCEGEGPDPEKLYLTLDERKARLVIAPGPEDMVKTITWEVRDHTALEQVKASVEAAGVSVEEGSQELCDARQFERLIGFDDPDGHRVEVALGAVMMAHEPVSKHGVRFVTGDQGLGHVVLPSVNFPKTHAFYSETLGFRDRGSFRLDPQPGAPVMRIRFMSTNPRHHTLALMPSPSFGPGLIHIMVEVETLDMVGEALDRANSDGFSISSTLGRHTNDKMVSFYVRAPGGWDIEYGCGGRRIDENSYLPEEITADSYWGHDWSNSEPLGILAGMEPPADA